MILTPGCRVTAAEGSMKPTAGFITIKFPSSPEDSMAQPDFYFNPFDADFRANPYPHFPALLDGPPRQLQLFMPTTLIARYDDVVSVLHDHERFTVRRPEIPFRERVNLFGGAPQSLISDPPVQS